MTELEKQLATGLKMLSGQYALDMDRLETQSTQLAERVLILSAQVQTLTKSLSGLNDKLNELLES